MKYNSPSASPLFSARNRMFLLLIALFSLFGKGYAQNPAVNVFEDWNTTSGTQNNFQRATVRSKGLGGTTYYYVCGSTLNSSGNYDMLLEKKNAAGTVLWSHTYNGAGNGDDYAADVQIDNVGNVYICGTYYKNSTDSNNAVLIKYNTAGTHQWTQVFNGAGSAHDGFTAMQLTSDGILVAGTTWQNSTDKYDMIVMRYDTTGSVVWTQNWDYNDLNDIAVNLYSSRSRIYVAGGVQTASTTYQYGVFTVLYSDGSYQGSVTAGGSAFGFDQLTDLQYDDSGYVYLTGGVLNIGSAYDIKTVKLDSLLNTVWSATYSSAGVNNDVGTGVALDQVGNVLVTGYRTTATSGKDYVTIKYSRGGTQRWVSTYDGGINEADSATCIVVNPTDTNKIYVSGFSYNRSSKDYQTLKYDGLGNLKWNIAYNNLQNGNDRATAIALDTLGNVIVAGQNKISTTTYIYTTVKYVEKNTLVPQDTISQTSNSFVFTENRGQVWGTDSAQHPEIKYYTVHGSPSVFFMDTAVSYVFAHIDSSATPDSLARVDMKFKNANPNLRIRALDQREEVSNFYKGYLPGGREQVHNYDQLVSFNVWNNVDMVYGSNKKGLKYYFICKPGGGGNPATQIDLKYDGADSVKINGSGQLVLYTKLGNIVQPKAAAWQLDGSGNYQSLGWQPSYTLLGTNEVGFTSFGSFNSAYPLIIAVDWGDIFPAVVLNLDWSTYYGGSAMDQLNDVDVNQSNGSTYYAGWTLSSNWPHLLGAFQSQNSGGWDAVAIRCKTSGARVYATYYGTGLSNSSFGGQWAETGALDATGNFFIGGRTAYVFMNITFPPQPPGSYMDTIYNGGPQDGFIAAFDSTGQLFWATYYGGSGTSFTDAIYDLTFDANGNLYAAMTVDSLTPSFFQAGAYNDTTDRSGMILKFDSNLDLVWATKFGAANGGVVSRLITDAAGNLYATGIAKDSLSLKNPGGGAYMDSTLGGGQDAFIARFDVNDSLTWSTYFGGNTGLEYGNGVEIISNELYVYGATQSTDYPFYYAGAGTFLDSTYNGNQDLFISEFKANGQQIWSTYYGGSGNDSPGNIDSDISGNAYFTAGSTSTNFPLENAFGIYYDSTNAGGGDIVLFSFNNQKQPTWSTYFGGTLGDGLNEGLDIYADSCLYICGGTSTTSSMASPFPLQFLGGAYWQGALNGTQTDGFISRFILTPLILLGTDQAVNSLSCSANLTVFPNPSGGQFQVLVTSSSDNRRIEVYDVLGQLIETIPVPNGENNQSVSLNLSEQATGVYFVVLQDQTGTYSQKVIKQ